MIKRLLTLLISSILFTFIFSSSSFASNQSIVCDLGGCSGVTGPIFSEVDLLPTEKVTQIVTATNNHSANLNFAVEIKSDTFSDSTPSMANIFQIMIIEQESGLVVYSAPSITVWKNAGFVSLSNIPSSQTRHYDFIITMKNVGNEYQGKLLVFDLILGFDALPPSSSLAVTPISCDNRNFDAIITLINNGTPGSGIDIEFTYNGTSTTRTTNSIGEAQVSFTQSGEQSVIATPQSGGYSSQSFFIIAPTGCPGGAGGGGGAVAGITTTTSPASYAYSPQSKSGSVQGASDDTSQIQSTLESPGLVEGISDCVENIPWWIPLIIQLVITFIFYLFISHREENKLVKTILIPTIFALLSQLAHIIIGCGCISSSWCIRYWLINLLILAFTYIIHQIRFTLSRS
jgi:hypothetical protein